MRLAFLATCVPRPHGDADVGGLDRGGVVHAVAGHGDDVTLLPEGLDEQHLVLGRDASDHADVVDAGEPLLVAERGELRPEHRLARDAELLGDGGSGGHVVAGDHAHPDAGLLGVVDGRQRRLAGRVDHGDDRRHLEVGDVAEQVALGVEGGGVEVAERRGHHPLPLALHAGDGVLGPLLQALVPGHAGCRGERAVAARLITAGAAPFTKQRTTSLARRVGGGVEGRHQLVGGVERQRGRDAGTSLRLASMSSPALWARTSRAPSVGSPTTLPFTSLASLAMM